MAISKQTATRVGTKYYTRLAKLAKKSKVRITVPSLLDRACEIAMPQLEKEFSNAPEAAV